MEPSLDKTLFRGAPPRAWAQSLFPPAREKKILNFYLNTAQHQMATLLRPSNFPYQCSLM
jgi:hypothetical protein